MGGKISKGGFEWHLAADPSPSISAGHGDCWGWIISPGFPSYTATKKEDATVHNEDCVKTKTSNKRTKPDVIEKQTANRLTTDSATNAQTINIDCAPWIEKAHDFLTKAAKNDKSLDGAASMIDTLPSLWRHLHDDFLTTYPHLNEKGAFNKERPWINACLLGLKRTRSGLELRYATTGDILLGMHSGITDRWVKPTNSNWLEQQYQVFKKTAGLFGITSPQSVAAYKSLVATAREKVNTQGGPSAWMLGESVGRGWLTGCVHISETPFSAALVNNGALALVDTFNVYDSEKALFDYIRSHKRMDLLVSKLRDAEGKDFSGKKHPREKSVAPVAILSVQGE